MLDGPLPKLAQVVQLFALFGLKVADALGRFQDDEPSHDLVSQGHLLADEPLGQSAAGLAFRLA